MSLLNFNELSLALDRIHHQLSPPGPEPGASSRLAVVCPHCGRGVGLCGSGLCGSGLGGALPHGSDHLHTQARPCPGPDTDRHALGPSRAALQARALGIWIRRTRAGWAR